MERKMLITGFDPFGGEKINPAWEAVKRLPDQIGEFVLKKRMVLPYLEKLGEHALRKRRLSARM